ncbi:hypothetical protein ASC66_13550 [Leifsonia sp. Root4]|uniref:hypothetical protein n=1 Tax=Leifsonia sp. Root4 TaxID=1736525 RepID=UPI0006F9CB77|nr:hypothetical protein [Leifsonia sp. Root4]KQW04753.1 hypothetical protein ASC66_13550 [Leifsonia sp. Root4]
MSTIQKKRTAPRGARNAIAALAALGVIAALAACGATPASNDSGELKTGNEQAAYDDWQRDFNTCLSDEGIDMGDLEPAPVEGTSSGDDSSQSTQSTQAIDIGELDIAGFEAAQKKCVKKLGEMPTPPGMPSPEEMQKNMLAFAKCMREAGYDYPDPEVSTDGSISMQAMTMDDFDPAVMEQCGDDAGMGFSMSSSVTTGESE